MVVKLCAVVEVIKREYDMSKKNANANLFGVVMLNVKCVIIEGKNIFAIKKPNKMKSIKLTAV